MKLRKERQRRGEEQALVQAEEVPALPPEAAHQMQELWLVLAQQEWNSLAVLPAHADGSINDLARGLAEIGKHLSDQAISTAMVSIPEPGSTRALSTLARHMRARRERHWTGGDVIDVESDPPSSQPIDDAGFLPLSGKLIIGVPSVVSMPVALAVAHAADLVILGVELGRTTTKDLRRSVELIGRDRIAGSVLY